MQTALLHVNICNDVDKLSRGFSWGSRFMGDTLKASFGCTWWVDIDGKWKRRRRFAEEKSTKTGSQSGMLIVIIFIFFVFSCCFLCGLSDDGRHKHYIFHIHKDVYCSISLIICSPVTKDLHQSKVNKIINIYYYIIITTTKVL